MFLLLQVPFLSKLESKFYHQLFYNEPLLKYDLTMKTKITIFQLLKFGLMDYTRRSYIKLYFHFDPLTSQNFGTIRGETDNNSYKILKTNPPSNFLKYIDSY